MSAFVVSMECMDRAVSAIAHSRYKFAEIRDTDPDAATKIGRALYEMNIRAVQARYPDTIADPASMPGPANASELAETYNAPSRTFMARSKSAAGPRRAMHVTWYKAIQCLLYQCSEGDVPESELYLELQRFGDDLARAIVSDLPEYDSAPWG